MYIEDVYSKEVFKNVFVYKYFIQMALYLTQFWFCFLR